MSIGGAPAGGSPEATPAALTVVSPALPSRPWRRAALFLVGAARLITIAALVGADPVPATWSSLLLVVPAAGRRASGNSQYYGRFMTRPKPGSRPSLQARLVAVTLAEQTGRALAAGGPTSGAG